MKLTVTLAKEAEEFIKSIEQEFGKASFTEKSNEAFTVYEWSNSTMELAETLTISMYTENYVCCLAITK